MPDLVPTHTSHEVGSASTALFPIGSFEQHGAHLPLATDAIVAMTVARELADAYDVQLLPPLTISCSQEHQAFPGTVSIRSSTLGMIVDDVAASLRQSGVQSLVLVNCHGGNAVLSNVVRESSAGRQSMAIFPSGDDWKKARRDAGMLSSHHEDMHGGELETSILLHAHPELVHDGYESADWIADDRRLLDTVGMEAYTTSGIIGRPSLATAAKGELVLRSLVESFAEYLETLKR